MNHETGKSPEVKMIPEAVGDPNRPVYEPPKMVSYTSEEILEQVGPAQACSPAPCGIF